VHTVFIALLIEPADPKPLVSQSGLWAGGWQYSMHQLNNDTTASHNCKQLDDNSIHHLSSASLGACIPLDNQNHTGPAGWQLRKKQKQGNHVASEFTR
jgi:hypothetical protein